MLTERRRIVLRAVVDHHVTSAAPVGSGVLAKAYSLNASPATIRSELGALENGSFVYQPHTSAGRVPTQTGYRQVVDEILSRPHLTREADLSYSDAPYPHKKLHMDLRRACAGQNSLLLTEFFRSVVMHLSKATASLALLNLSLSRVAGLDTRVNQLYYNGLASLLTQPEFLKPGGQEGFTHLVNILESERVLGEILEASSREDCLTVSIGTENCDSGLSELSLVACRYKSGTVAVIGPTRMNYKDAIAAVSTAAHTLDDILE